MRNIAILEWGPASLYYLEPRELIKVRSVILTGGPVRGGAVSCGTRMSRAGSWESTTRPSLRCTELSSLLLAQTKCTNATQQRKGLRPPNSSERAVTENVPGIISHEVMPPFLYTKDEAKKGGIAVRYVLAASEDLNKVPAEELRPSRRL